MVIHMQMECKMALFACSGTHFYHASVPAQGLYCSSKMGIFSLFLFLSCRRPFIIHNLHWSNWSVSSFLPPITLNGQCYPPQPVSLPPMSLQAATFPCQFNSTLHNRGVCSSEIIVPTYSTTQCHNLHEPILNFYHHATSISYNDEWFKTVLHTNGQLNCYNNLKDLLHIYNRSWPKLQTRVNKFCIC